VSDPHPVIYPALADAGLLFIKHPENYVFYNFLRDRMTRALELNDGERYTGEASRLPDVSGAY